ncbi:MAG: methylmalonyl-CoA mutase family protein [Propionibacteriaceae bacterium]|jgi:methylmalonyl-CoA mutase|nr:methylmalonyl-CoA mutase family protein [Propionibacteriaceae bacterium]
MTDERMVLAGDFAAPTREEWERETLKALNRRRPPGKELTIEQVMKRLTTVTVDGVEIDPLYLKPDDQVVGYPAQTPFTRGSELPDPVAPWVLAQLHEDGDVTRTKTAVANDLNSGATGLWLRVESDAIAAADVAKVLDDVVPDAAPVYVSSVAQQSAAADAVLAWLGDKGAKDPAGCLGIDPIAAAAGRGLMNAAEIAGEMSNNLAGWIEKTKAYPKMRALSVDVTPYDNAGAGDVDQLAFAIATGIEYVRVLADQGVSPTEAFDQIMFRVSATADEFLTVARLRALRRLWARVGEVLDVAEDHRGAVQHAVTSWRVLTKDDPWVNLLRATIGAFSAAVGGAEVISVLPHDTAYGLPTKFSRRIARNISLLTAEESHIGAVKDPAGGAWVFESLTEQLAQKAWARVQEIEAAGGMSAAWTSGAVTAWIEQTASERAKRLATRKLPLTGVSMFPKQDEEPLTDFLPRPDRPAWAGGLTPHRDAEVFEGLRNRSRAYELATGHKPTVLLACLGQRRDFGGREQFSTNLLLVGGLDFPEIEGPTPAQIVEEAAKQGADTVLLASSAKVYAEQAMAAAKAAKDAGLHVLIAGRITEIGDDGAKDLIDSEIFDGMDVVAFLTDTLDRLEVAK